MSEVTVLAPLVPLQKKIYEFLKLLTSGSSTSQHQSLQNILVQLRSSITSVKFQTSIGHSSKNINCTQDEENHFQISWIAVLDFTYGRGFLKSQILKVAKHIQIGQRLVPF